MFITVRATTAAKQESVRKLGDDRFEISVREKPEKQSSQPEDRRPARGRAWRARIKNSHPERSSPPLENPFNWLAMSCKGKSDRGDSFAKLRTPALTNHPQ